MAGTVAQIAFFVALIVVIVVHEAAHFGVAKRFGIKVEEFFVGFGPRIWSFRRGETEYGLKAIPAGGRHQAHSSSAVMAVAKARAKARRRGQVALTKGLETAAAASVA